MTFRNAIELNLKTGNLDMQFVADYLGSLASYDTSAALRRYYFDDSARGNGQYYFWTEEMDIIFQTDPEEEGPNTVTSSRSRRRRSFRPSVKVSAQNKAPYSVQESIVGAISDWYLKGLDEGEFLQDENAWPAGPISIDYDTSAARLVAMVGSTVALTILNFM